MDLLILDKNIDPIAIIDTYVSLLWTDRYSECGDFELYNSMSNDILEYIKQDYYVQTRNSEYTMIVEKILIKSDVEEGANITIAGRSLESILDRRVVWGEKTITGSLQDGIKTLLNECIISPSDSKRKIDNFIFEASDDPRITKLTIDALYTGDNLYEIVQKLCSEHDIGFKITLNENKQFVFKLYAGVDRSFNQTENPYVIFSPKFDNLINSNYIESKSAFKNAACVASGEDQYGGKTYAGVGNDTGLDRRELFVDANDITSGEDLLMQRGLEELTGYTDITSFEGQAETTIMYKYGKDFFIGDVLQIANEYGNEATARVTEFVISVNEEGTSMYPAFKAIS